MSDESYPEDLRYHREHDWARVEGEEATFGITWYAQDALGEVVFYEPPETGAEVTKDQAYAEVESVKTVSMRPSSRVSCRRSSREGRSPPGRKIWMAGGACARAAPHAQNIRTNAALTLLLMPLTPRPLHNTSAPPRELKSHAGAPEV